MTKQSMLLGLTSLALVGAVIAPQAVLAYKGDPGVQGPNYTVERHEAMQKAFETNDYEAWKSLRNNQGRVAEVITAENFPKLVQAHELASQGKLDEAKAIRAELGLGLKNGSGNRQGQGRGVNR